MPMNIQKITSRSSEKVKRCARLFSDRSSRYKERLFAIEGKRLCHEACLSGTAVDTLFFTEEFRAKNHDMIDKITSVCREAYETTEDVLKKMTDTVTPQGIVCICCMPDRKINTIKLGGYYVALEDVADPSNIGAVSRSAAAFEFDGIMLTKSCADPFSPKALRASMGALLRLPVIIFDKIEDIAESCRKANIKMYAGLLSESARDIREVGFNGGAAILIGNEGRGLSKEASRYADEKIFIPMSAQTESLNAAAAASIIMWECRKNRS